ncbi:HTH-type transcriptional regulator YidZ [Vibrio lentus]|jgi:DNA-binding transcriptional LysR family regulator|uniref:DNA-binding transcriptional regulator n=1 Tax=Vibrio lentus TaxID=136468 RepID=A0AB36XL37_9VIBR|nr:HTH-type transcriptional regulator YidZ [Vibrio lentus]MCC4836880.1 HTH-type transcriptional regulator YidZ [Vibrio lentus]PMI14300.1 DNA-binding transcriptional regulator [Vibrio lentus]PMK29858.1 DNA-binding transcriptional regulator [Vibrio lentus]PMK45885.1 DNA-binding transcriptional regulator [Vibrio lentus]PML29201.1 DNA-binding transcriptional regulator [Vibrio lentus]
MKKPLARLDLNLLFTLQLLLQEQSVSKAAKKLNVTPSTVSKSLTKLRDWFDDPLFVKTPRGLTPTPLALSMVKDLQDWLQIGSQILTTRGDDAPKDLRLNLEAESPLSLIMLNELTQSVYQRYPDAKIKMRNWDYDSIDSIVRGESDIGFSGRESHPRSKESLDALPYFIDFEVLFHDLPVVYLRKDHPALQEEWNLEAFLKYPHINIVWEKSETWALDEVLTDLQLDRNIVLTLAGFEQSLFMTAQSNHTMTTVAPNYCRRYVEQLHPNLTCLPIPLDEEHIKKLLIPFTMIWHKRNAYNPIVLWLKDTLRELYQFEAQQGQDKKNV